MRNPIYISHELHHTTQPTPNLRLATHSVLATQPFPCTLLSCLPINSSRRCSCMRP